MKTEPNDLVDYLTKREHFATQILSGSVTVNLTDYEMAKLANNAVRMADYLIMALNSNEE